MYGRLLKNGCKVFLLLVLLFPQVAFAQQRVCVGVPLACGKTDFCVTKIKNMNYQEYANWLNTGTYTAHELLYQTSSIVIVLWREQCVEKDTCWDQQGTCNR